MFVTLYGKLGNKENKVLMWKIESQFCRKKLFFCEE